MSNSTNNTANTIEAEKSQLDKKEASNNDPVVSLKEASIIDYDK